MCSKCDTVTRGVLEYIVVAALRLVRHTQLDYHILAVEGLRYTLLPDLGMEDIPDAALVVTVRSTTTALELKTAVDVYVRRTAQVDEIRVACQQALADALLAAKADSGEPVTN